MRRGASDAGSTLMALLVIVLVCGGLVSAVLLPAVADSRTANAALDRERAFQLAESGIDWAIAIVRRSGGALPDPAESQRTVGSLGDFVVLYESGGANSIDDDGDGTTDESDESDFIYLTSTGRAGSSSRTLEVVLRSAVQVPELEAAVQFNVDSPILDLKGNAFLISGVDHDLEGTEDLSVTQKSGIASPALEADLIAQIPAARQDQIQGLGGTPSISQISAFDLGALVDQAKSAASIVIEGGTHTDLVLGEPTESGVVVAYASSDIHLSGNAEGAGILIVDGDLRVSGSFTWRGLVIVRGRVTMTGGGSGKRVIGGLVIGEEITSEISEAEVVVAGTVDLLYSSEAIRMASGSLVVMSVLSWQEVGTP